MSDTTPQTLPHLAAMLQQAQHLRESGRLADALDACIAILADAPEHADTLWLAGSIALESLSYDIAEACFQQALALQPTAVRALIGLAQVYESRGQHGQAVEFYSQALALEPDNPQARAGIKLAPATVGSTIPADCYEPRPGEEALCSNLPPPRLIELEPSNSCNLRCRMCHVTLQPRGKVRFLDSQVLADGVKGMQTTHLIIGSEYEPTIHPQIDEVLAISSASFSGIDFITNASRLHKISPRLIAEGQFSSFTISFDGITQATFESIREGADFRQIMANIRTARTALADRGTVFAINYVVTRSTLPELEAAAQFWNELEFDLIRVLPMQLRDASLRDESIYPCLDEYKAALERMAQTAVANQYRLAIRASHYASPAFIVPAGGEVRDSVLYSGNPAQRVVATMRQDVQHGQWQAEGFPCRSPFTYARIRWDGSVDLCNRSDFNIGNLHDGTLLELWQGEKANAIRRHIRRTPSICQQCDYYRFCIAAPHLDIDDPLSHFADGVAKQIGKAELIKWFDGLPNRSNEQ